MTLTVSRVLTARPEALIDAAGQVALSAAAAGADIAGERANLVTLAGNWGGSAAATAQLHGAELLAGQERYRAKLLAMQQVLAGGGATLSEIRGQLAALVTGDLARAERVSARLSAGTVWVNCFFVRDLGAPFGGNGQSGIGREGGVWSFDFYADVKNTVFAPNGWKD